MSEALHTDSVEQAELRIDAAIAETTDDPRPLLELAELCRTKGDHELARRVLERVVERHPDLGHAWEDLGTTLLALGDASEAIEALDRATRVQPGLASAHLTLGLALADTGREPAAIHHLQRAVGLDPESVEGWTILGRALGRTGRPRAAIDAFDRALTLRPEDADARALRREVLSEQTSSRHVPRLNDRVLHRAYERALRKIVRRDTHVLHLGTGSGLLPLMAARAGAERVTTCDASDLVIRAARGTFARNGHAQRIVAHCATPSELQLGAHLPRRADVLLVDLATFSAHPEAPSVTFDDVRARLLGPNAAVIPFRTSAVAALVGGRRLEQELFVGDVDGFDLSGFGDFAPRRLSLRSSSVEAELFSGPQAAFSHSLQSGETVGGDAILEFVCTRSGRCSGIAHWLRLDLDVEIVYESDPTTTCGWEHVVFPFASPLDVRAGQRLRVRATGSPGTFDYRLVDTGDGGAQ